MIFLRRLSASLLAGCMVTAPACQTANRKTESQPLAEPPVDQQKAQTVQAEALKHLLELMQTQGWTPNKTDAQGKATPIMGKDLSEALKNTTLENIWFVSPKNDKGISFAINSRFDRPKVDDKSINFSLQTVDWTNKRKTIIGQQLSFPTDHRMTREELVAVRGQMDRSLAVVQSVTSEYYKGKLGGLALKSIEDYVSVQTVLCFFSAHVITYGFALTSGIGNSFGFNGNGKSGLFLLGFFELLTIGAGTLCSFSTIPFITRDEDKQ
jgi:hypothetical protein